MAEGRSGLQARCEYPSHTEQRFEVPRLPERSEHD